MAEPIPKKEIGGAYELPDGWVWAALSEICKPKITKDPKKNGSGEFIYLDIESIDNEIQTIVRPRRLNNKNAPSRAKRLVKSGDVIISLVRPYLKNIALIPEDLANSIASTAFYPLKPENGIDSNYLFHIVRRQSFIDSIVTYGDSPPSARDNEFIQIQIPLPPLAEQHHIVAKLEALLAQVHAAKDHLAAVPPITKRFRQSMLAAACSGRLTEYWRREHLDVEPASELLKRIREERIRKYEAECQEAQVDGRRKPRKPSNITQNEFAVEGLIALPNGWTWAALDDLSANEANSITDGPFGSKLKTEHYTESGPRVIRLQNIGDGKFIDAKAHISPHHFEDLRKHEIFGGDIVIAALGTDLPRACIIPNYVGHAIVKADCIRFKPHPSITNNQYMNASLNSDILKHIAQSIVHGVGRPRLNQQQVKSLPTPLPPLPEQHAIVRRIETLFHRTSKVEERVAAATAHADRLTQSILAKAFRGELVPQDPDDEPASVLLERIRKERTELEKKKKPQKRRSKTLPDSS
ncbi:MAG: restriction endonuclease subunit S [Bacteroidetes bacterium]|nr:restriction endonuclease subunit S [Bacteroidota bacterium]